MSADEQAKIILNHLDKVIQINWNFEKFYMKAIKEGFKEIEGKKVLENE